MAKEKDRSAQKSFALRVTAEQYDQIKHFATRDNVSMNTWIANACSHMVDFINADYNVPQPMVVRQNQLIDMNQQTIQLLKKLIQINIGGFDAMSNVLHGDNYLSDNQPNN